MGCSSSKQSSDDAGRPSNPSDSRDMTTVSNPASGDLPRIHQAQTSSSSLPRLIATASSRTGRGADSSRHRNRGSESSTGFSSSHRRMRSNGATGNTHLNPPPPREKIKRPPNAQIVTSSSPDPNVLSRALLEKERGDFFDTRVTGRREVWDAVRVVAEHVERGDLDGARTLMIAAGCSCPSGDLHGKKGGIYDEKGYRYVVPTWVLGEPAGTVGEGEEASESAVSTRRGELDDDDDDDDEFDGGEDEMKETIEDTTSEKGKGKAVAAAPSTEILAVRARLSSTGRDVIVKFKEEDTVGEIATRVKELARLSPDARLKIMYLGKPLGEDKTLIAQGWQKDNTLICFVFG